MTWRSFPERGECDQGLCDYRPLHTPCLAGCDDGGCHLCPVGEALVTIDDIVNWQPERRCYTQQWLRSDAAFPRIPSGGLEDAEERCPATEALLWEESFGETCIDVPICSEPLTPEPVEGSCCYAVYSICGV